MNCDIRLATPADVDTLFEIRCSVRENHQSEEELEKIGVTRTTVAEMLRGGDYVALIAAVEGVQIGFTMAQISEGYVFACFLRPEFEGKGIGGELMRRTEVEMALQGVREAWLSTGPGENLRAVGFYSHLGWKRNGHLDDGQIRFEKTLKRLRR